MTNTITIKRQDIIDKAVEKIKDSFDDYEKSLQLIDKHNLPAVYGVLGSDAVHGAASNYNKKITVKNAYTPKTITTRTLQRMALGALAGAGYSYYKHDDPDAPTVLKDAGTSAAVGALLGATIGPAMVYVIGKGTEQLRQKIVNRSKGTK